MGAQAALLGDGRRLHLHHGPIDLIVDVTGPGREAALRAVVARFDGILQELVDDLEMLRQPVKKCKGALGPVAARMRAVSARFLPEFVTPMAAVAGAVADEMARVIAQVGGIDTAYVNNGGDVALVIGEGHGLTAELGGGVRTRIGSLSPVRGVATSGWRGRSLSFGIADAVTVLAASAAEADVAATLIANHVNLPGHPAITRDRAVDIWPDSDLGARRVTTGVGPLRDEDVGAALAAGAAYAETCKARGLIEGAWLCLNGATRHCGADALLFDRKEAEHA